MRQGRVLVLLVLLVLMVLLSGGSGETKGIGVSRRGRGGEAVLEAVTDAVKRYVGKCHLLLVSPHQESRFLWKMFRSVRTGVEAGAVVVVAAAGTEGKEVEDKALSATGRDFQHIIGFPSTEGANLTCRAVLLVSLTPEDMDVALRFLEMSGLWRRPSTRVVVVGMEEEVNSTLLHDSLRNTEHGIYLALQRVRGPASEEGEAIESVRVYQRCLYCGSGGVAAVHPLVQVKTPSDNSASSMNLQGRLLRAVGLEYGPFILGNRTNQSRKLNLWDCVDRRVLNLLSRSLNFTYETVEPKDGSWGGTVINESWNGIVGELQRHEADFSLNLTPTSERLKIISFTVVYTYDGLIIVSLKPEALSQQLALTRPFTGGVWLGISVVTVSSAVSLWVLQRVWSWVYREGGLEVSTALCFSWGVLLENPPTRHPHHASARVLVGWWLLTAMVITTAYRSSLVGHLSVLTFPSPINNMEHLLARPGWSWGLYPVDGSTFLFFIKTTDPVTLEVYKRSEVYEFNEGVKRVLAGQFSFMTHETKFRLNIERIMRETGHVSSPFHISSSSFGNLAGNAWGFRSGAPFLPPISERMQWMIESGLITRWIKELNSIYSKVDTNLYSPEDETRRESEKPLSTQVSYTKGGERGEVVLGLQHLQGAFILLLLGHCIAAAFLLGEHINAVMRR